jgi:hypothetical protein
LCSESKSTSFNHILRKYIWDNWIAAEDLRMQ